MSKKDKDEDIEGIDDLVDEEIQSVYPKFVSEEGEVDEVEEIETEPIPEPLEGEEGVEEVLEEEFEEDLEFALEEEIEIPQYKYVDLEIAHGRGANNYEVIVKGQSHGFLNLFIKHLLNSESVKLAAYKKNNIEQPRLFIRINEGYKIKEALREGINAINSEISKVEKEFISLL